jgi:putative phosphoesterase
MPDPSTTRIALIGDVHANLPALDAVLAHAHQRSVQAIWNMGDFVGYGPFPEEVVGRLRQEQATSIVGNYDIKVLKFPKRQEKWRNSKHPKKWLAFQWAYEHLSRDSRKYLRSLPKEIWTKQHGKQFLLTHGSPASNEEPLTPDTPDARLGELARLTAENYGSPPDAILCGHSHRAFSRQVAGSWFINTGSVGRPNDGDPRTGYAILELGPDRLTVDHYRLEYDVEKAVAAIRANDLPESFAEMLLRGLDLDTALS